MKTTFAIAGLSCDFWGAILLVYGLIRQQATVIRHIGEDSPSSQVRPWPQCIALWCAKRFLSSSDIMGANTEPLAESLTTLIWATVFLCLGFALQILSYTDWF